MLTEHTVVEAVRAAGIPVPPRFVPVTGSTNEDLLRLAGEGAREWTVVVAGDQRAGRGRLGRTWVSAEGASLLVSVLLRPRLSPGQATFLSLAAAVAAAESCREVAGVDVRCKWPNDLLAGGRKVGGILTEATVGSGRLLHAVVGLGLNVGQSEDDFPPELRRSATSQALEGGSGELPLLLEAYLRRFRSLYGPDGRSMRTRVWPPYLELCDTLGRIVRARTVSGEVVVGRAEGLTEEGALRLDTAEGTRSVAFGEIEHLR